MYSQINVRVLKEKNQQFEAKLAVDNISKQKFIDFAINLYLQGKVVFHQRLDTLVDNSEFVDVKLDIEFLTDRVVELENKIKTLKSPSEVLFRELNNKFNSKIKELENEINALKNKGRGFKS